MSTSHSAAALTAMLPPRPGRGMRMDWAAVEEAWGLEFPSDYKQVIAHYGDVLFGDYLQVLAPSTVTPDTCDEPGAPRGGMGFITADARDTWMVTAPTGVETEAQDLVVWGAASSADLFCWLARGEPDEWPVVVFSHGEDTWTRYDVGMTEFLVRVLRGQPGFEVMIDTPLWGDRHASYANSAERRRAREGGADPKE
ncbi:hypothetical protein DI272_10150 [Streptomyces sp. Act143]|uniref:SMI1/KNR4 family protein n=1 Tax=Streptomyces sp. Act143 TaxID=2200760 RepID=UPI000D67A0E6|nr:SMI1/KNR4 family protein [Streptomyces sp. Act143]PWI14472.1 hypothetical protein DI272_10150 [Streptomyces sp. Act143]